MLSLLSQIKFILFVCIFALSMAVEEPIIEGTAGSSIVLKCSTNVTGILPEWNGPPDYTIYSKRGIELLNPSVPSVAERRLLWMDNKKDLVISPVQKSDEGYYQCMYPGLGEYQFRVVVIEIVDYANSGNNMDSIAPHVFSIEAIAAIVTSLVWIIICTFGICLLHTQYCRHKFLVEIRNHMKKTSHKLTAIILLISCYFVVGWVILLYKVMLARLQVTYRMADTNHDIVEELTDQGTSVLLPQTNVVETEVQIAVDIPSETETSSDDIVEVQDWVSSRKETIRKLEETAKYLDDLSGNCNIVKLAGEGFAVISGVIGAACLVAVVIGSGGLAAIPAAAINACAAASLAGGGALVGEHVVKALCETSAIQDAERALQNDRNAFEAIRSRINMGSVNHGTAAVRGVSKAGVFIARIGTKFTKRALARFSAQKAVASSAKAFKFAKNLTKYAGPVLSAAFLAFDIADLVYTTIEMQKGSINAAANEIRSLIKDLKEELQDVIDDEEYQNDYTQP